jgi:RHS repeat-associated protein
LIRSNGVEEIVTKWFYDSEGRLASTTDAQNQTTEYQYDGNDNQVASIDALGRRTESVYDEKGQLVETIYPDNTPENSNDNYRTINLYDKGGRQRGTIDEAGRVTHYKYDAAGRLIETIYPLQTDTLQQFIDIVAPGQTAETIDWSQVVYPDETPTYLNDNPRTITEYDRNGQVLAEIDEHGNRTEYRYDDAGRLIETIFADDTPDDLSDNPRSKSEYDAVGRQVKEIDALNRVTEFIYDELGRVVEMHFADGTKVETIYDAISRRVASIDQAGNKTEYEYDVLGRLTDVVQFLDGEEIRTEYEYDELGRNIIQEDANDHRTIYEYDKLGRRTAVELPEGQSYSTIYDAVGNVLSATDFNGETTTYQYDEQNRQIFIDLPDDSDISLTYTPTGQRETVTDGRGTTSYKYNVRDWLISRTDPTGPYLPNGNTIEYEYDAAGNRTLLTTPGGFTSYEFDERNRLETVTDSSQGTTTYIYDAVSNLIQTVLPNGVVENREYDELNRLEYLENKLGSEVISSYDYELNEVGNRISVTEHDGRQVEYEYDSLYRLVEEKIIDAESGSRTITYTYDKVGNRLSRNDSVEGETTYQYNDNDWLLEEQHNGDVIVYEYDNNGNTIKRVKNGTEETVYIWDAQNRLVEVRNPSGDIITYTYDVDNIRVSETVNGVTTQYIVDKNRDYAQVIEEYVDGELEVRYVHGLDLIFQERDGEVSVYLVDGLGSTRLLTDGDGSVTNVYVYDAFGNLITKSGTVENDYQFAGEQYDENLEQYYLRQRYYDPGIGRFTKRDTYEGRLQEPITLHKYLYGNANPVNYVDPSGFYSLAEHQAAVNIATALANIQAESGSYLISATLNGGDYDGGDFLRDFLVNAGAAGGIMFFSWALRNLIQALSIAASGIDDLVRVYRVEGEANARIIVSKAGEVFVQGDGTLFLTFGQRSNAEVYLKNRLKQYPDSTIKSFEVPKSYVDDLRARSVPERGSRNRAFRDRPIKVHPRRDGDYGLRSKQDIELLKSVIIQGSGRIES